LPEIRPRLLFSYPFQFIAVFTNRPTILRYKYFELMKASLSRP
jgi:hypothetical protein